jgi:hypothetical protein
LWTSQLRSTRVRYLIKDMQSKQTIDNILHTASNKKPFLNPHEKQKRFLIVFHSPSWKALRHHFKTGIKVSFHTFPIYQSNILLLHVALPTAVVT